MSLVGATSALVMGMQATSDPKYEGKWQEYGIPAATTLLGEALTQEGKEAKALREYNKSLLAGISSQELRQGTSEAEADVLKKGAAERQQMALRGGVSSVGGGTSGARMNYLLAQQREVARRASEEGAKRRKLLLEHSAKMRALGAEGIRQDEATRRADQEKAMGLMLTSDIGGGTLDAQGKNIANILGTPKEEEKKGGPL